MKKYHVFALIALTITNVWFVVQTGRWTALCKRELSTVQLQSTVISNLEVVNLNWSVLSSNEISALKLQGKSIAILKAANRNEFVLGFACGNAALVHEIQRVQKEHPGQFIEFSQLDANRVANEAMKLGSNSLFEAPAP